MQTEMPWKSGFFQNVPWLGFAALLIAVLCTAAAPVILILSNGKTVESWPSESLPVQPAVLLAIFTSAANALLLFALRRGATIAWWLKMLMGADLNECHRYWAYGISVWKSMTAGTHFNKVALACIFAALVVVDGPLMQRASTTSTTNINNPITFMVALSPDPLPFNFSGIYMTHSPSINYLTPDFTKVVQQWTNRSPIVLPYTDCKGRCSGTVVAAGWDVNCTSAPWPYELPSGSAYGSSAEVGFVNVTFLSEQSNIISVETLYKPQPGLSGNLIRTNCQLHIAQVNYPVELSNSTLTLPPRSYTINDTVQLVYGSTEITGPWVAPSALGGISLAAYTVYYSDVSLYYAEGKYYAMEEAGSMGYTYINSDASTFGTPNVTWSDPTPDIIAGIRELTFRSAVSVSNVSSIQHVNGYETAVLAVYNSHYEWLGGALGIMCLTILFIMPLNWGWWRLGRKVSLSPVETAKAFQAPLMAGADSNGDINVLLRSIGERKVKYGAVEGPQVQNGGEGLGKPGFGWQMQEMGAQKTVLGVADLGHVSFPREGQRFDG